MFSIKNFRTRKEKSIYKLTNITFIVFLTIMLILGCFFLTGKLSRDISAESFYTLRSVSTESSKAIMEMLQSRVDYLNSVWLLMNEGPENLRRDKIRNQQSRRDLYNFEWIGYTDVSGIGWNSIGLDVDLSDSILFRENKAENICLAEIPIQWPDSDQLMGGGILLGIPVYEDENVPAGFLYQIFSSKSIASLLDVGSFDGEARFCLMDQDGDIVAASESCMFSIGDNIFERLQEGSADNRDFADQLAEDLHNSRAGGGYYTILDEGRFSYYLPISLQSHGSKMSISMLSAIPENSVEARVNNLFNSVLLLLALVLSYVTVLIFFLLRMKRRQKQELERLAYRDVLTGEANYEAFKRDFKRMRNKDGILIACDIVEFKLINRYFGARKGDEVIRELGRMFAKKDGTNKIAARVSDDQFIFFFPGIAVEEAGAVCQKLNEQILEKLRMIYAYQSKPVFGYCASDSSVTIERLRGRVMFAKSLAKMERTLYHAYDEQAAIELTDTVLLLDEFDRTLENSGIEAWYQPKYDVRRKCVGGAEALVRWRGKDGRVISPGRFIPLLEERGKIVQLDEYVFEKVCLQQKKWLEAGMPMIPVSVNISRGSLLVPDIVHRYQQILERAGIGQDCVYLEITEESVGADAVKVIREFRQAGFYMLMDDFGRGNSNLANLRRDLFQGVKFDKTLIDLIDSEEEETVLRSTMEMVRNMGMQIVAEGVEKQEQVDFLEKLGCDEIQGYFYYRPMEAEAFARLLETVPSAKTHNGYT